jgi:hypothetical protein
MARRRHARTAAGRCAERRLRDAERGRGAHWRRGARGRPRRHSRRGALARRPAVLLRQRPLRARQGAVARGAQRLRRRAARPAPADLCAVPGNRSRAGRRERAPDQDRGALSRRTRGAPGGAPRHRGRAGRPARRRRAGAGGRAAAVLQGNPAPVERRLVAAGHEFRGAGTRRGRYRGHVAAAHGRSRARAGGRARAVVSLGLLSLVPSPSAAFNPPAGASRLARTTKPGRWAARWRSCRASTSWPRTARGW